MATAELELATLITPTISAILTMKALVYHGPGKREWQDKLRPTIQEAGDAIVRITTSTICGTDLHILKGDLQTKHVFPLSPWRLDFGQPPRRDSSRVRAHPTRRRKSLQLSGRRR